MKVTIIGIDAATNDSRIGLSLASWVDGELVITEAQTCSRMKPACETLASWTRVVDTRTLLAVDAPLGWPVQLREVLATHLAGEAVAGEPDEIFMRSTDRFVREQLGKTPFSVGADRIARTAHSALKLLRGLASPDRGIELAWSPALGPALSVIEVYPAATMRAHGLSNRPTSEQVFRWLGTRAAISSKAGVALELSRHTLDAVVCAVAAADFLKRQVHFPSKSQLKIAQREGWIWFYRPPSDRGDVQPA